MTTTTAINAMRPARSRVAPGNFIQSITTMQILAQKQAAQKGKK